MLGWPLGRFWKLVRVWKALREMPGNLGKRLELSMSDGPQDDLVTMFLDEYLRTRKSEGFGQSHGLTAAMLEDLGCHHSYILYL